MTPLQELSIRMGNDDAASVHLVSTDGGFRPDIDYQPSSGPLFEPHAGPVCATAAGAFDFMLGIVDGIAKVRSTSIVEVANPCNTEFLDADTQKAVLKARQLSAAVSVNGEPT
jgi:hypothetical protein